MVGILNGRMVGGDTPLQAIWQGCDYKVTVWDLSEKIKHQCNNYSPSLLVPPEQIKQSLCMMDNEVSKDKQIYTERVIERTLPMLDEIASKLM